MSQGTTDDDFTMTVTRLSIGLRMQAEQVARDLGITSWQGRVLAMLSGEQDAPFIQRDITEHSGMPPASVTRLLNGMEDEQLLERRPVPGNNRSKTLHLLPRGREVLQEFRDATDRYADQLLSPLSSAEQQTLLDLLHRVEHQLFKENA